MRQPWPAWRVPPAFRTSPSTTSSRLAVRGAAKTTRPTTRPPRSWRRCASRSGSPSRRSARRSRRRWRPAMSAAAQAAPTSASIPMANTTRGQARTSQRTRSAACTSPTEHDAHGLNLEQNTGRAQPAGQRALSCRGSCVHEVPLRGRRAPSRCHLLSQHTYLHDIARTHI
eukprot:7379292-Prymnesium_polylepis.1